MTDSLNESTVEHAALEWFADCGWKGPETLDSERSDYCEVVLEQRLREALANLNPDLPSEALEEAFRKLCHPDGTTLEACNRTFHRLLVNGVTVEYYNKDDVVQGAQVSVLDFDNPNNNDWLIVNQFYVVENKNRRRLDVVLFVNGLPLGLIELKSLVGESTTLWKAWQQLQTYKAELPTLFSMNEVLMISNGCEARIGTLTAGREWFKPWRTLPDETQTDRSMSQLQVMIAEVCKPRHFLMLIQDFIVFDDDGSGVLDKKMAGYHQFYAVETAVIKTLRAVEERQRSELRERVSKKDLGPDDKTGDRRIGVIWHTQGSGKSLTMAFYAGRIIRDIAMKNPTIVVLTDRNDLDDQLFTTFSRCSDLLRQQPVQATSRDDLRTRLRVRSGGVVFTTIHKFFPDEKGDRHPLLSERRNIVVIADEAHRSQYDFIDGFARHMRDALPNASFIGFTGTPIELRYASTKAVFGEHISIYDILNAVEDGATVPIYYESRLAILTLDEEERPKIDADFEEVTEREEYDQKEKLKRQWARLEAIVGTQKRLEYIATDIVEHFERRLKVLEGKAMIVCMSRRICIDLYHELVRLRQDWEHKDDDKGKIKIVMTGAPSDPSEWQQHIRNKPRREVLAKRFRDPDDSFQVVLVRDMWLTGFDAPSLHTLYVDKPMRGHGLMQTIARVNRVFKDKPGGLIVDYLGLARELKQAIATYTESGGKGKNILDQSEAVAMMQEKYEVCKNFFHGFNYTHWRNITPAERLRQLPAAQEHILAQKDGKSRYIHAVRELSQSFALAVPHKEALRIQDDVAFFQKIQSVLMIRRIESQLDSEEEQEFAIRQILSRALMPEEVVDIYESVGLNKPDISILSEEFLAEVRDMPQPNLAVELLHKLLKGEIATLQRRNIVQARSFTEMLNQALQRYHQRTIETAMVVEELINLVRQLREENERGKQLGLSEQEVAFYDALEPNDSAVQELGTEKLCAIARELVKDVHANLTIDWYLRENVLAKIKVSIKRILRKHDYPTDKQDKAASTVLEQTEGLSTR